jgi:hypothetical protein
LTGSEEVICDEGHSLHNDRQNTETCITDIAFARELDLAKKHILQVVAPSPNKEVNQQEQSTKVKI